MESKYVATPIAPQAKPSELNRKFKANGLYTAGDVITAIHNYLPYWIPIGDLGISHDKNLKNEDPRNVEAAARKQRLIEFMENISPSMFPQVNETWHRYGFNRDGQWMLALSWLYVRDEKIITVVKLAFG